MSEPEEERLDPAALHADRDIDGRRVRVVKFTGFEALNIAAAVGSIAGASDVLGAFGALSDSQRKALFTRLLRGTTIDGAEASQEAVFNLVFQGRLDLLMLVLKFVLEANLAGFLSGPLGVKLKAAMSKVA